MYGATEAPLTENMKVLSLNTLKLRIVLTVFLDALMRWNALKCADKRFSLIKIIE